MSEGSQGETSTVGPFHDDPAASLGHGSVHDVIDPESGGYTDADVAPRFPVACLAAVLLGKLGLLYRLLVVGSPLVVTENDACHSHGLRGKHARTLHLAALVPLAHARDDGLDDGSCTVGRGEAYLVNTARCHHAAYNPRCQHSAQVGKEPARICVFHIMRNNITFRIRKSASRHRR